MVSEIWLGSLLAIILICRRKGSPEKREDFTEPLRSVESIQTGESHCGAPTAVTVTEYQIETIPDEKRQKILNWLAPNDLRGRHDAARERHDDKTGDWFLQSPKFIKWKRNPGQFLWLTGNSELYIFL